LENEKQERKEKAWPEWTLSIPNEISAFVVFLLLPLR
jgi:hypothetical protein